MNITNLKCNKCVLDIIDDPSLILDDNGICNYCRDYYVIESVSVLNGSEGDQKLKLIVDEIKKLGTGKKYDCILGLSGGVDSTYLAYLAKQFGLRPLAVHFDNGWDSELAVQNIENIINKLGFDLHSYVVDWPEFKDVQLAYIKASVIDIEAVTDHAILGTVYRLAKKYGVRSILSGTNVVTEAILPSHWIFNKADHVNLLDIHRQFGTRKLKTFPLYNTVLKKYCNNILNVQSFSPLNYVDYNKARVKEIIIKELGWRDYGGKHYESIFTRFYQGYILPTKFGVDKRKAHLSNLICSGQITRDEALLELQEPIYDPELLKVDMEFVLKKLGLSREEFDQLMQVPPRSHYDFATERPLHERYPILKPFRIIKDVFTRCK